MALAIDVMHSRGPSNKIYHQLQPNTSIVNAVLSVNIAAKGILPAVNY